MDTNYKSSTAYESWLRLPPETRARYLDRAEGRLASIKNYQLTIPSLTAIKKSCINDSSMGAGKTFMAIFHAYLTGAKRTAVAVSTRYMDTWQAEITKLGMRSERILDATDAKRVREQFYHWRKTGTMPDEPIFYLISWEFLCLGGKSNTVFDPWYAYLTLDPKAIDAIVPFVGQFLADDGRFDLSLYNPRNIPSNSFNAYKKVIQFLTNTISKEALDQLLQYTKHHCSLLADENRKAFETEEDKIRWIENHDNLIRDTLQVLCNAAISQRTAAIEAKAKNQPIPKPNYIWSSIVGKKGIDDVITNKVAFLCESPSAENLARDLRDNGWPISKGQSYRYEAHNKTCPACGSGAPIWNGSICGCGYTPRCYRSNHRNTTELSIEKKTRTSFQGSRKSNRCVPAVGILPKFDLKIVDEFHNVVSLDSLHGRAIYDLPADNTLLLSGTICRTFIHELEAALALVHDENSPEFPYSRYDLSDFRDRFCTYETKTQEECGSVKVDGLNRRGETRKKLISRTLLPEASNLNSLRRLLHQRLIGADEATVYKEWQLPRMPERSIYFDLTAEETQSYRDYLRGILDWRNVLREQLECNDIRVRNSARTGLVRGVRSRIDKLADLINGPTKAKAAVEWAYNECVNPGRRGIIVCRSVRLYRLLKSALKSADIEFHEVDHSIPNEERGAALDAFRDSKAPILLTRIKLVCENFNQLVCCTRLLFCQVECSPAHNRQMQRRINRPGQTSSDLRTDFLIARIPDDESATLDEIEINRFLRRESAIDELQSRNRPPKFRKSALAIQAVQQQRGLMEVLEDLANKAKTEFTNKAADQESIHVNDLASVSKDPDPVPAPQANNPARICSSSDAGVSVTPATVTADKHDELVVIDINLDQLTDIHNPVGSVALMPTPVVTRTATEIQPVAVPIIEPFIPNALPREVEKPVQGTAIEQLTPATESPIKKLGPDLEEIVLFALDTYTRNNPKAATRRSKTKHAAPKPIQDYLPLF